MFCAVIGTNAEDNSHRKHENKRPLKTNRYERANVRSDYR
jgi:hypothetical protein